MKILEAAVTKRSNKLQQNTMTQETKENLELLFHKAANEKGTESLTATAKLAEAHAELHKQSTPPISP